MYITAFIILFCKYISYFIYNLYLLPFKKTGWYMNFCHNSLSPKNLKQADIPNNIYLKQATSTEYEYTK